MAPADNLSPPGSSAYSSNTMTVGDGTWDFTKNTFLLPNLVGLNFETMRYNGMGNRFSTLTQYHSLILSHGVLAAITFLFLVPIAVLIVRFYARNPGYAVRYHAYMQILAVGFSTVIFILGFMAVGPARALTNPHHGIGVAIYVLILLQAVGGRLVRHITGRSLRVHLHRWSGRAIAILGIIQVPLGLTLYGSPKYLFILYAVWMAFLAFLFFVLDYRDHGRRGGGGERYVSGGHSDSGYTGTNTTHRKASGGRSWLGPLAAGAGIWALMRSRSKRNRDSERGLSRSPSPGRSHLTGSVGPEVIPSPRRESSGYYDEKRTERRRESGGGGGFMNKMFAAGAGAGAGALFGRMLGRRDRGHDDNYSAVATDTPSRTRRHRRNPPSESDFTVSERTEDFQRRGSRYDRRSPLLPPPGNPVMAAAALSAAEERPVARPRTPQRSHAGQSRFESTVDGSDYSSYVSPSRRASEKRRSIGGGSAGKGLLAGIGLGWLGKKAKDGRDRREEERLRDEEDRRRDEEDRRSGNRNSRYTSDGYPTPTRRESRRQPAGRPPPPSTVMTSTVLSGGSSIEPRGDTPYDPAPVGNAQPPPPVPVPGGSGPVLLPRAPIPIPVYDPAAIAARLAQSKPQSHIMQPVAMPPMPTDPHGIFGESGSEAYISSGGQQHRRHSSRRGAAESSMGGGGGGGGDAAAAAAAAAAVATASHLAAEEDEERRRRERSREPVSVKVQVHDRDKNITLRRLTDEEQRRRRRNDSVSSQSEADASSRRYRRGDRDSSQRRAEAAAEQRVDNEQPPLTAPLAPLSPPNPAFAQGRSRPQGKDSAYYSGQPGPSGGGGGMPAGNMSMSSFGMSSPVEGGGAFSAISPSPSGPLRDPSVADRRRRRRLERREGSSTAGAHGGLSARWNATWKPPAISVHSDGTNTFGFKFPSIKAIVITMSAEQGPSSAPPSQQEIDQNTNTNTSTEPTPPERQDGVEAPAAATTPTPTPATAEIQEQENGQEPEQQQPDSPPLPAKHTAVTPGPRAARLQQLFSSTLKHTLDKINRDNFASCFPTIATNASGTLEFVQGQMVERIATMCNKEFNSVLENRNVVAKLNELESLVSDAARRKAEVMSNAASSGRAAEPPVPPHTLPAPVVLAAHLAPHLASQQSQLNAKLQNVQAHNARLSDEIRAQRAEMEALLAAVEKVVADVDGANELLDGVVDDLAKETRAVEVEMGGV
ncbi:hypothetical protein B0T17DRAFT_508800 [Bombardia bombarda]|uniref:Cytochrome b561 domain-containing protein n=1 Tax=Bombardia bombarda TaxID=252184 RepID=A0AA39WTU9_9PEZI|nr:hypothetical protein B0T17DRAFT_508800 [Bombardia bombarda]